MLLSNLVSPLMINEISLGTRITYPIGGDQFSKYISLRYKKEVFDVNGIPLLLFYRDDISLDRETEIVVICKGMEHNQQDLVFNVTFCPLLEKGFAIAVPMIRGTRLLGLDWMEQGTRENKFFSINDFHECIEFLNSLSDRISLFSDTPSGGLHCLLTFFSKTLKISTIACFNPLINIERDGNEEEFGNLKEDYFKDLAKLYNPALLKLPRKVPNILLLFSDKESPAAIEGHNLVARIRRNRVEGQVLIKEDRTENEDERNALMFAWIVGKQYLV